MRKGEVSDYLSDIKLEIRNIRKFTSGKDFTAFSNDTSTFYACMRSLEIIGEAAKNIPADFKKKHPEVPWKSMAGTRDVLIHGYFGVSKEVVWKTVTESIPALERKIASIVR